MNFMMLSATVQPAVTVTAQVYVSSTEEQDLWDNYMLSNKVFDAGVDHTNAAVDKRKCLEKEATDFGLWCGTDFLPEEDPNNSESLLEELEQNDELAKLLENAHMYYLVMSTIFDII